MKNKKSFKEYSLKPYTAYGYDITLFLLTFYYFKVVERYDNYKLTGKLI
jgi:hypothetical protein